MNQNPVIPIHDYNIISLFSSDHVCLDIIFVAA